MNLINCIIGITQILGRVSSCYRDTIFHNESNSLILLPSKIIIRISIVLLQ